MNLNPEIVTPHRSLLGEGPVWDEINNRILWLDILKGEIHQYHPDTEAFGTMKLGKMVGCVVLQANGCLIAALEDGFAFVDIDAQTMEHITHPESHIPDNRFNDGKCDPAGRFWAGTMSKQEVPDAGSLYVLDANYHVKGEVTDLTISNGMAWSADSKTYYLIDTPTRCIDAFDYDLESGSIANRRTAFAIPESEGLPDGMTIDAEGMLWVAHYSGWQVSRWNPDTGQKLLSIPVPVENVTCCTFGGKDLTDLYITTAFKGLSDEQIKKQPLAGCLFVVKNIRVKGLPPNRFKLY
ncbi:SMP-30/gluconolactonase/LRE family protein [Mucilaginibacter sp. RS28]|uniref:Regucalcin n=1 Tax=Mucilaginibacter straminoryzae TaxID=2932774 RepID=A0A9X1X4R5_9SPHI|nr:SMP-30/gluconolactonase/LRE family protein [Mucilaginibacter straminoryzae]MCJ8210531.1 SMP-30/gluconolactonase/LRE family protein [Mucilaginibacter straminoryzae]